MGAALLISVPLKPAQAQGAIPDRTTKEVPGFNVVGRQTICELRAGPRAGERNRLRGTAARLPVGAACGDGEGSTGVVIPKAVYDDGPTLPDSTRMYTTCMFDRGPRAGERERGVTPGRLGTQCADRKGSFGTIVGDQTVTTKDAPRLGGIPEPRCRPNRNPRLPPVCRITP